MIGGGNPRARRHAPRTGAFTLVEMLVVIVIITLLAALVTPAVFMAMRTAKEARVAVELNGIQMALENYKQANGTYPPDFAIPVSNLSGLTHAEAVAVQINQHLGRVYRYRNANHDLPAILDQNGNGTFEDSERQLLSNLDPAEAIVFWLQGFSSDKQRPIYGRAVQMASAAGLDPYFAFDKTRLADIDGDGFFEYYAKGLDQAPYVYYRSDRTNGPTGYYNHVFTWHEDMHGGSINEAFVAPALAADAAGGHLPNAYFRDVSGDGSNIRYAEEERFQLISAGLDGLYGAGGLVDGDLNPIGGIFPTGPYEAGDKDNVTNFSEGPLEDSLP